MSDYDNTNSGVLFKNETKKTEKHPDYSGTININGVDHWLSAWIKESKDGSKKFMSLSIGSPKQQQNGGTTSHPDPVSQGSPNGGSFEDIPFIKLDYLP